MCFDFDRCSVGRKIGEAKYVVFDLNVIACLLFPVLTVCLSIGIFRKCRA